VIYECYLVLIVSSSEEEDVITVTEVVIPKQKVDEARKWQFPDAFY